MPKESYVNLTNEPKEVHYGKSLVLIPPMTKAVVRLTQLSKLTGMCIQYLPVK